MPILPARHSTKGGAAEASFLQFTGHFEDNEDDWPYTGQYLNLTTAQQD
jgi:hypothetical protein